MQIKKRLASFIFVPALVLGIAFKAVGSTSDTKILKAEDISYGGESYFEIYYADSVVVRYETDYSNASFIDFNVKIGDEVVVGDVIATISSNAEAAKIKEQELKLIRAQEDLVDLRDSYTTAIADADYKIQWSKDHYSSLEISTEELNKESIVLDYERRIAAQEEYIKDTKKLYNEMTAAKNTTEIKATADGKIADIAKLKDGATIYDGSYIAKIDKLDEIFYVYPDAGNIFRYGMQITLDDFSGNKYHGEVVSCASPVLSSGITVKTVYVRITDELPERKPAKLKASYDTISYKNAIVLEEGEFYTDENGTYVIESTLWGNIKHYFTPSRKIGGKVIALDGLSEGMTIVIEK